MKSIHYYFVRHGETEANRDHLIQGWSDSPLTEKGKEQLTALSKTFANIPIHLAYSSDLERSVKSAEILLATQSKPIHAKPVAAYREFNYGGFEGRPTSEVWDPTFKDTVQKLRDEKVPVNEMVPLILDDISQRDPEGTSENFMTFWNRIEEGILEIYDTALETLMEFQLDEINVAIITHDSPIRYFLHEVLAEFPLDMPLDYGAYAKVTYSQGTYKLIEWNKK